jgi:Flp pilus assembly protein TadD
MGEAHRRLGHTDRAIEAFRRGFETSESGGPARRAAPGRMVVVPDPDLLAAAHLNLGCALATKRDFVGAIHETRIAIAMNATGTAGHNNLGTYLLQLGRYAEAEAPLRRALELWPDSPDAHTNLGVSLMEQGKLHEAEPHLRRAVELVPGDDRYLGHLAVGLFRLGKLDEAHSVFEKVIELEPDRAPLRQWLAATLDQLGRPAEAEREYRKAVQIEPSHSMLNGLARFLALAPGATPERGKEAASLARRALRTYGSGPDEGALWNTLGLALCRAGDCEAALKALDRSARLLGVVSWLDCLFWAMAHERLGRSDEARGWYEKGIAALDSPIARERLASSPGERDLVRRIRAEAEAVLGIEKETKQD